MNIARVEEEDILALKDIARRAIMDSVIAEPHVKEEIIADTELHIDQNVLNKESVFLKCVGNGVEGFILIQEKWNLSDLFVNPSSHGKGIGRLLFNSAKELCRTAGNKNYIRVNSSINSEQFYRNVGFSNFISKKEVPCFVVPLIYNF